MGPVAFQPSELAKIALVIMLAKYYSQKSIMDGLSLRDLMVPIVLTAIPFVLIGWFQPDLGTGMLLVLIAALITGFVKVKRRTVIGFGVAMLVVGPLLWAFFFKPYQIGMQYALMLNQVAAGHQRLLMQFLPSGYSPNSMQWSPAESSFKSGQRSGKSVV